MSLENPLWGAPHIHGELLKLGHDICQSSIAKYMARRSGPPNQTWQTFIRNHMPDIAAIDFFTVHTAAFNTLFVFLILSLDRRRIIHFNVTRNPTAEWTSLQLIQAFPFDTAPQYLIRDRDSSYGPEVINALEILGVEQIVTAPRSPWQNGYCERVIGTIRRECLARSRPRMSDLSSASPYLADCITGTTAKPLSRHRPNWIGVDGLVRPPVLSGSKSVGSKTDRRSKPRNHAGKFQPRGARPAVTVGESVRMEYLVGTPSMTPISSTQWADTLNVDAGCSLIKFRTDFIWDDNPDYGRCSSVESPCQIQVPADIQDPLVDETCLINGPLAIGEVEFLVTGSYEFILDESASTYSIRYLGGPQPLGSISGTVAFADNPPVSPVAIMVAIVSGSEILAGLVETDPADDSFLMEELPTGTYDLWFASAGYEDIILEGVIVNAPDDTDLGTITLSPANTTTMMQVLGDFNQWDIQAPPMSHPSSFVWVDTLSMDAGCSFIKFRTNGVWGDDYCRCSGSEGPCQSPVPTDAALVLDVCLGSGTGNALGEVEFPESADYVFIVNEQTFTCTIHSANVVNIEGVSWGRIKALYR